MGWVEHAVWWHVYPLGAVGADPTGADRSPAHRLGRLTAYLDHAVGLGASGVALGPVFESSTHGYDTTDHFRIDPRLGSDADFDELLAQAHRRGLRVMLDGVFNHVGRDHPALASLTTGTEVFEGHQSLVTLDHSDPAVADLVVEVMCHWLGRGADAWRLDAAYAVPTAFWRPVLPRVRERFPDVYVVGEVLHGDYSAVVRDTGMDAVTQYELWKAVWSSLADANFFELAWALQRHDALLDTFVPLTFVGNHDVTRIASRIRDPRHRPHAVVLLMTLAGTPSVYYGDEVGMQGVKEERAGGDDAVRPALPESPADLGGADVLRLHQDLIGLRRRHSWLHTAPATIVHLTNTALVYDVGTLRVLLNLADPELWNDGAGQVLAGAARSQGDGVGVPGHGWAVTRRHSP